MDMLIAFFTSAATSVGITDAGLSVILIILLGLLHRYVFKPMHKAVDDIPTHKDISDLIDKGTQAGNKELQAVVDKLNKIEHKIERIESSESITDLSIKDLRRDIESVKTILNQFQGHMMYGVDRRSSDMGNQQLK